MIQPSTVIHIWTPSNQDVCVSVRVRVCTHSPEATGGIKGLENGLLEERGIITEGSESSPTTKGTSTWEMSYDSGS